MLKRFLYSWELVLFAVDPWNMVRHKDWQREYGHCGFGEAAIRWRLLSSPRGLRLIVHVARLVRRRSDGAKCVTMASGSGCASHTDFTGLDTRGRSFGIMSSESRMAKHQCSVQEVDCLPAMDKVSRWDSVAHQLS